MSAKIQEENSGLDILRWAVVIALLAGGIVANFHYAAEALPLRLAAGIVVFCVAAAIAAFTVKGKEAVSYAREARVELRKVVWPNRQETVQTAIIVIIMVFVAGTLLWAADGFLLWLVGWLTGQRG